MQTISMPIKWLDGFTRGLQQPTGFFIPVGIWCIYWCWIVSPNIKKASSIILHPLLLVGDVIEYYNLILLCLSSKV